MTKIFQVSASHEQDPDSGAEMFLYLPATPYELLDGLDKLRLPFGMPVQVWVEDVYMFDTLSEVLTEQYDLYALNDLAHRLSVIEIDERAAFQGLVEMELRNTKSSMDVQCLLDLAYSTDGCHVIESVLNDSQLGWFYAENGFVPNVVSLPDDVFNLLDFERIGRERRLAEGGVFTPQGYVLRHSQPVYHSLEPLHNKPPEYVVQMQNGKCLDCCIPRLTDLITEAADSPIVAHLEQALAKMEDRTAYKALLEVMDCYDLQQAELLADTVDDYIFTPEISSPVEMAKHHLAFILPEVETERIIPHLNLYQYGQALMDEFNSILTPYGMLERRDGLPILAMEDQQSSMTMQ